MGGRIEVNTVMTRAEAFASALFFIVMTQMMTRIFRNAVKSTLAGRFWSGSIPVSCLNVKNRMVAGNPVTVRFFRCYGMARDCHK